MFFVIQIGLDFLVGPEWSQLRDPEYDAKLAKLRERLAEFPQRPLILVLGSSRSMNGVNPEVFSVLSASVQSPMVFNFALSGVGPRQQLVILRRLLAEGIRPEGVLSEILPVTLYQAGHFSEDGALKRRHMQAEDLAIRNRASMKEKYPVQSEYSGWLNSWYQSRLRVLRRFAPAWVESEQPQPDFSESLDLWGWSPFGNRTKGPTAVQYQRALTQARRNYEPWLAQWKVSPIANQAVHDFLTTCQREQIRVALYLMPEGSLFRAWYRPEVRKELDTYLTGVCRQHKARLLDATLWNSDEDFWDGHHLLADGATRFSQRFGRELLEPFVSELRGPAFLSQQPTDARR